MALGYPRSQVEAALRTSGFNPDLAVSYLEGDVGVGKCLLYSVLVFTTFYSQNATICFEKLTTLILYLYVF